MHKLVSRLLLIAPLALAFQPSRADHGRDFLLMQDARLSEPSGGSLYQNIEWTDHEEEEWSLTSGILLGLTDRLSGGLDLRFADEGRGWGYSSVTPHLLFGLTPTKSPVQIALEAGYEFGQDDVEGSTHSDHEEAAHSHEEGHHHHEESAHQHGGIHRHGESALHLRLILESDLTNADKVLLNLVSLVPDQGPTAWGYAVGYRHSFTHDVAMGVEATGDFGAANEHLLLAGAYISPLHHLTIKTGVGFGLTEESPDLSLRLGAVWRF